MTANSKFSIRQRRPRPPRICKAVGDTFRFVTKPFKREMSWWTSGEKSDSLGEWIINGTGTVAQIGNPLQRWSGTIGDKTGNNAFVDLTYDTIVNVLTIIYIGKIAAFPILTRTRILHNIDLDKPFSSGLIELPPPTNSGPIFIDISY